MCLDINKIKTEEIREALRNGPIKVYKALISQGGNLLTPYYKTPFKLNENNFFVSNRDTKNPQNESKNVNYGIHVYLSKIGNSDIADLVLVEGRGYLEDFIAAGYNDAVFSKVEFKEIDPQPLLFFDDDWDEDDDDWDEDEDEDEDDDEDWNEDPCSICGLRYCDGECEEDEDDFYDDEDDD